MILGAGLETTLSSSSALQVKALGFLVFIGFGFGMSAFCSTMVAAIESPISEHGKAS